MRVVKRLIEMVGSRAQGSACKIGDNLYASRDCKVSRGIMSSNKRCKANEDAMMSFLFVV